MPEAEQEKEAAPVFGADESSGKCLGLLSPSLEDLKHINL